jgi:hypothetical protein
MWVLALGTNDWPKSSAQLRTDANTVLSAIGPDHFVWIGIGFYAGNDPVAARVNSILSEAVAAAPNGSYTSWNSWIHSPLRGSGANWVYPADPIHMTKQGYAIRNEFYGRVVNRLWP